MDDHDELDNKIPAEEIQEVLAELGLEISLQQAAEVANLLQTTGDLEQAMAALDELMEEYDGEEDGFGSYYEAA